METISIGRLYNTHKVFKSVTYHIRHIFLVKICDELLHLNESLLSCLWNWKLELPIFDICSFIVIRNQKLDVFLVKSMDSLYFHEISHSFEYFSMTSIGTHMEDRFSLAINLVQLRSSLQKIECWDRTIIESCIKKQRFIIGIRITNRLDGSEGM